MTASPQRTGGQLVVDGLRRWGVDTLFALPGVQLDWFVDAIVGDGSIRMVHTRHEQATSYMADGYARATGKVGVCAVVPGPGVLNAGAGLATAYACNSPVLCIAGQIFTPQIGLGRGVLHEIVDQLAVLRGVVGWAERATQPSDIPALIDAAFARLTTPGRRRPAAIEVGWDTLPASAEAGYGPLPAPAAPLQPDGGAIEQAAAVLAEAARPVIYAGAGCWGAGDALLALAGRLGAPVVLSHEGKGSVSDAEPLVFPDAGGAVLLPWADVVLFVGTRAFQSSGPLPVRADQRVIRIDVDPDEFARATRAPDVAVLGDASISLGLLVEALDAVGAVGAVGAGEPPPGRLAALAETRAAFFAGLRARYPEPAHYCGAIRDVLPPEGVLVDEMTQVGYFARNGYGCLRPRTYIGSGYQGTLGFGFPTALGAKVGVGDTPVVSISGDGGFLYNCGELATAAHHGIGVVAVVFHDGAFGNVRRIQNQVFGRELATSLSNPDFAALAASFGLRGTTVTDPSTFRATLADAVSRGEPCLIDVPIGAQPDPWPVLQWREPLAAAPAP